MEPITEYFLKSMVWLTGFAMVYMLFLRNERFFVLNRIFLITGLIASVLLSMVQLPLHSFASNGSDY